jgi:hypothetical protein
MGNIKAQHLHLREPELIYLLLEHSENIFHILLLLSLTQLKVEVMKQQLKLPM